MNSLTLNLGPVDWVESIARCSTGTASEKLFISSFYINGTTINRLPLSAGRCFYEIR